jgi:hypothetical protein
MSAPEDPAIASRSAYTALTDIVLALLDARPSAAQERFDSELAAAVTAGKLDGDTARTLRWWQRESDRGVRDYLAAVLPGVFGTLESATADAAGGVRAAADAWQRAGRTDEPRAQPAKPIDITSHRRRQVVAAMVPFTESATHKGPSSPEDGR